jgi:hypothetical protein
MLWDMLPFWSALVAALIWLFARFYLESSRGTNLLPILGLDGFPLAMLWALSSVSLAIVFVVFALVAIHSLARGKRSRGLRISMLLVPFLLAAALAFSPFWSNDWPTHLRFNLSRGSMDALADQYEQSSHNLGPYGFRRAGLYQVEQVYGLENCVIVVTGSIFLDELGFARCEGEPAPQPDYITLEHLTDNWYTFEHRD